MKIPKTIDIPIDFCPKCNNEKIRVVLGRSFEEEFSLSGKCLRKQHFPDTTYTILKCTKCGWQSEPFGEGCGFEEFEKIIKNMQRKRGKNKMSWDVKLKAKREIILFQTNITYNLSDMYYKCIDKELGLKKLNGLSSKEALPIVKRAIEDMIKNKEEYEKLNPSNGWGSYDGLLRDLRNLKESCEQIPDGVIEVD